MDFKNYDEAIHQSQAELERVRLKAEELVQEFKKAVPAYLSDWANYLMDRAITNKPEVVESIGIENVGKVKERFSEILKLIPSNADKRLEGVKWAHRGEPPENLDTNIMTSNELTKITNESLDVAIRDLIGEVGALLIEYGFVDRGPSSEWQVSTGRLPRYSYGFPHYSIADDKKLRQVREQYGKIVEEYTNVAKILGQAEKAKKVAQAKNTWNRA
jgi:hypothetical protein